ncbi:ACR243Wp [Eremothecium gossypii ATCC 10895]|uniref:ACR243Wp n=1 Tax=Eremothecium gossypii (strain ATCC 10895 / CBS 109.51 / FGSC 9923 / NRRL Y-1056) TaxID=284811 RepID=Q75BM8_EREGS|nr:ACR243Wp [Eremothecium gossypii ATCC 10895]AAS51469.1 ACR243Wp [Eremothecium gossypii ATCC 10895]AEY95760.1 FACR243Wp [Eremothecium gossypii FDAG1]
MVSMSNEYVSDSSDSEREVEERFEVPAGFKQCKHLKDFKKPKGSKQELWLMKLPSSVDIGKLKKIPVDFAGDAPASFSVDGKKYVVREDLSQEDGPGGSAKASRFAVLAPRSKDVLKADAKLQIAKFFNVSESVEIPAIDYDRVRQPRKDVTKVTGLKTRHFATGYDAEDFADAAAAEPPKKKHRKSDDKKEKKEKKDKEKKKEKKEKRKHKD